MNAQLFRSLGSRGSPASAAIPSMARNELASGDGVPTEGQRQRLARAERRMQLATRIDLP